MKRHLSILLAIAALALAAPAFAEHVTLTGTVVSSSADSLVISTADGQKTFVLNDATLKPMDLAVGSKVTVTYNDQQEPMIASQIAAAVEEKVAEVKADVKEAVADMNDPDYTAERSTSTTTESYSATSEQVAQTDPAAPAYQAESTVGVEDDDALPATASKLPMLALIGLLACASAVALRRVH